MAKFKLSRKRKKRYKKDVGLFYFNHFVECMLKGIEDQNVESVLASSLIVSRGPRGLQGMSDIMMCKCDWEWFYFRRRVEVRCAEVFVDNPTNENLLKWYKEHYPEDKLSHHYCMENRHKWDKFNKKVGK